MIHASSPQRRPNDVYEDRLRDQRSRELYEKAAKVHKEATVATEQVKRTLETIRELYNERERNG